MYQVCRQCGCVLYLVYVVCGLRVWRIFEAVSVLPKGARNSTVAQAMWPGVFRWRIGQNERSTVRCTRHSPTPERTRAKHTLPTALPYEHAHAIPNARLPSSPRGTEKLRTRITHQHRRIRSPFFAAGRPAPRETSTHQGAVHVRHGGAHEPIGVFLARLPLASLQLVDVLAQRLRPRVPSALVQRIDAAALVGEKRNAASAARKGRSINGHE